MPSLRAEVFPVEEGAVSNFEALALPFGASTVSHDAETKKLVVTVPDRAALEGLSKIPGFQVFPLDVSEAFADEAPRASSAAAVTGHGAPKRKPLPSKDVFYLMMDPNIALPLAFILMVVHVVASFFCRVFDCAPPVAITAALPLLLVVGTQRLGKSKASSHSPAAAEAGATLKQ